MSYIADNPKAYEGKVVGSGHCVPFVQEVTDAPHTSLWKRGELVKNNKDIKVGTAIATFSSDGKYTNSVDGSSHSAIYVQQDAAAIQVWDQWLTQPVHQRWIRFQGGGDGVRPVNDGDAYYIIA